MNRDELKRLEEEMTAKYKTIVVDAFIVDTTRSKILLQKRSSNRRLFPNMWDPIGGHLESGESIYECLLREIKEESTMDLKEIISLVHQFEWDEPGVVNLQFLVRADGTPAPEMGKASEIRWLSADDLYDLGFAMTHSIRTGAQKAFDYLSSTKQL